MYLFAKLNDVYNSYYTRDILYRFQILNKYPITEVAFNDILYYKLI